VTTYCLCMSWVIILVVSNVKNNIYMTCYDQLKRKIFIFPVWCNCKPCNDWIMQFQLCPGHNSGTTSGINKKLKSIELSKSASLSPVRPGLVKHITSLFSFSIEVKTCKSLKNKHASALLSVRILVMGTVYEVRWWECHHGFLCSSLSGGEKCLSC